MDNLMERKAKTKYLLLYSIIVLSGLGILYSSIFKGLFNVWITQEQYSYGPLIPLMALYIIYSSRKQILNAPIKPNYFGLIIVLLGYGLYLLGVFSIHGFTARFSFLVMLAGFSLFVLGSQMMRQLAFSFFILLFMIPFPEILDRLFSLKLRLLSSIITETILHTIGVSVFRQGNIIDIGTMQFNVADACSGMNYLLPLLALAALIGYFSTKSKIIRSILIISAVPITLTANVIRITTTTLIAKYWTPKIATGFMHDFSGWVVFMFAFFCLFIELKLLKLVAKERRNPPGLKTELGINGRSAYKQDQDDLKRMPLIVTVCVMAIFWGGFYAVVAKKKERPLPVMEKLPLSIDGYIGKTIPDDPKIKEFSSVTDSITRVYWKEGQNPISVYVGYYRTSPELKGFIHTPVVCLRSSGWQIQKIDYFDIEVQPDGKILKTRQVIAERGGVRQLLIYWYQIGDFTTGNEQLAHYYTGYDAIFGDYSDAVKVMISVNYINQSNKSRCKAQLQEFITEFYPNFKEVFPLK